MHRSTVECGHALQSEMVCTSSLLTQTQVAALLGCSPANIVRLRKTGRLAFQPGPRPLIDEASVVAFIASRKQQAERRRAAKQVHRIAAENTFHQTKITRAMGMMSGFGRPRRLS